jgi:hypothetical protein
MSELQAELQRLSGTTLDEAGAANVYAGTTGLELLGALNAKAGYTFSTQVLITDEAGEPLLDETGATIDSENITESGGLGLLAVCNLIAGTTGLGAGEALATISPVTPPAVVEPLKDEDGNYLLDEASLPIDQEQ